MKHIGGGSRGDIARAYGLALDINARVEAETARACIAECEEYTDAVMPSVIVEDIKRRFGDNTK